MTDAPSSSNTKTIAQKAVQANKEHQYALKVYTERLEDELKTVNKFLTAVDAEDIEDGSDLDVGGFILVPSTKKATGLISASELLSHNSPFYDDAHKASRYLNFIHARPVKAKELDALAEAVRTENLRMQAFEAQQRGQLSFANAQSSQIDAEVNKEGIDWERVAERVSAVTKVTPTPKECEIRWLGDRHPHLNHSQWTQAEISRLRDIVTQPPGGRLDWVAIAKLLGTNRTPIDCMRHGVYRRTHVWSPETDNRLRECVKIYGVDNWNLVARHVSEDATGTMCQNRYYRSLDPLLKQGSWDAQEDDKLRLAVAAYGNSWMDIASFIPGRSNDQCRDRWTDYADPSLVRGEWTEEEDSKLLQEVETLGPKWKEISMRIGNGRSDTMCRTRHNILVKRKSKAKVESSGSNFIEPPEDPQGRWLTFSTVHGDIERSSNPQPKPRTRNKRKNKEVVTEDDTVQQALASVASQAQSTNAKRSRRIHQSQKGGEDLPQNSEDNTPLQAADADLPAQSSVDGNNMQLEEVTSTIIQPRGSKKRVPSNRDGQAKSAKKRKTTNKAIVRDEGTNETCTPKSKSSQRPRPRPVTRPNLRSDTIQLVQPVEPSPQQGGGDGNEANPPPTS